ncbi:MAG: ATP-binding protein [Candidatus Pacebacteria bacterium]|nr:ATP-binding protein [Candidatus Paceibacterota bacterium]MCF7862712.1 ATP-binding protein [Candidatus Paceibacterota bacterium]
MKISKIEVENFKSIEKYDFDLKDINIFIGKNNHGKTNLFDALDWFDSGKTEPSNYRNNDRALLIKVRLHFVGAQVAVNALEDGAYKTAMINALEGTDEFIVEKDSENDKRVLIVNGTTRPNPRGFDSALNYFLPKIIYVTTKQRLSDIAGYKSKSPIAEMLGDVLKDMVDNEPKYKQFLELFDDLFNESDSVFRQSVNNLQDRVEFYLAKQFDEAAEVKFRIENPAIEDMLKKFETEVDDGIKTKAEHKGDGMQRAVMLAIVQAYADFRKEKGIARTFTFLIDEAELHLHPTAQRALKNALREIVENEGQVLINSHSPIFANELFTNQKIYKVEKETGVSQVNEIITEQEQLDSIYQLLGGSPQDILLPSNFIIVEGQSEFHLLKKLIEKLYFDNKKCSAIKILFARGDHEKHKDIYHCIHQCYTPLLTNGIYKNKVVFLMDSTDPSKQASFDTFKATHSWLIEGEQLHVLTVPAIEMIYPDSFKKTKLEVDKMTNPKEKINIALGVANSINTKQELQDKMPAIFNMLEKAIEFAYE